MKKKFKIDELPDELQTLVNQYIEAKQSLYEYDESSRLIEESTLDE